ncbi:MAG TPA: M48 family metallopeptidase [Bryobacteraceae bacterium]|nr:M48 family metallopeptidase [Bryobacteraceae bacterium]
MPSRAVSRPLAILLLSVAVAFGAPPLAPVVPARAQAWAHFDARAATDAWLATVPSAARARSDAYFEGGYWLILWDFLATAAAMLFLLQTRLSARMRDWAEKLVRWRALQSFVYWIEFTAVAAALLLPMTVYEGYFRERQYGLSNQTFGAWLKDQLIGFALVLALGGLTYVGLTAIVRRLRETWHIWGAGVAIVFVAISAMTGPVFLAPLFNAYKPLQNAVIKNQILSLARANGIPATDVYEMDASKQSKRVSANVSGFLGTERITLNDNLLNRASSEAILATMGHEMGHYVLHHITNSLLFVFIVIVLLFSALRKAMDYSLARWGRRWEIRDASDTAVLPLAALILASISFLFIPVGNTFTRTQEYEADIFGLNAARQPDGEAEVDLLLGEYRKLDPSPLEEFVFFDHPGGRTRIYAAMRWKAENLCLFDPALPCANRPEGTAIQAPNVPSHPSEKQHR